MTTLSKYKVQLVEPNHIVPVHILMMNKTYLGKQRTVAKSGENHWRFLLAGRNLLQRIHIQVIVVIVADQNDIDLR